LIFREEQHTILKQDNKGNRVCPYDNGITPTTCSKCGILLAELQQEGEPDRALPGLFGCRGMIQDKTGIKTIYTSKSGKQTAIEDLNSAHLINILRKLKREAEEAVGKEKSSSAKWTKELPEVFDDLETEAMLRGIDWVNSPH
jgi:hypothetical protein